MENMNDILTGSAGSEERQEQEVSQEGTTGVGESTSDATASDSVTTTAEQTTASAAVSEPTESAKQAAALLKEVERLREQNRQLKTQQPQPEKPDFWQDPEGIVEQRVAAAEERVTARLLNMSEAAARARHADFGDKLTVFTSMVDENPALYGAMLNDPDPGEFAYKAAARAIAVKEMGDPEAYKQKLEAELRMKWEKELEDKKKAEAEALIDSKLKGGFSEVRGLGEKEKKLTGQRPMSEILGGKK